MRNCRFSRPRSRLSLSKPPLLLRLLSHPLTKTKTTKPGIAVEFADEVAAACKWAAITCIVVNSPLLAKCAQTGAERVAGTVAGGLAGFGAYSLGAALGARAGSQAADGLLLAAVAAVVAWMGSAGGSVLGLAYSSKLFSQTFILVAFGAAADKRPPGGAAALAASRVLGIGGGVVLMEAASIVLWPRTATQGCLLSLAEAAEAAAEAAEAAWSGSLLAWTGESIRGIEEEGSSPAAVDASSSSSRRLQRGNEREGDIEAPLLGEEEEETPPASSPSTSASTSASASASASAADALDAAAASLVSSLATAADLAEQADAEIYIRKRGEKSRGGGRSSSSSPSPPPPPASSQPSSSSSPPPPPPPPPRPLFLPGPGPWTPAAWRALPKPEVERVCSALRKVGRALGALHACRPRGGSEETSWGGRGGGQGREGSSSSGGDDGSPKNDPPTSSSSPSPARALAAGYPPGLLRGAAEDCVSALRLAARNVPGPPPAEARAAVAAFGARAAALLRISDYNRRALARAAARGARGGNEGAFDAASRAASEPVSSFGEAAAAAVAARDEEDEREKEGEKKAKTATAFGSPSEAFESLPDSLAVDLTGEGSGIRAAAGGEGGSQAPETATTAGTAPRVRVKLRRLTSSQVAAAAFPPTAAGFEAQVRWYSLQLALQELSGGMEEMLRGLEELAGALPSPLAVAVPRTKKSNK